MQRARLIRIAAWVLGGTLVLVAALVALLHTGPAQRFALQQVVALLDKQGIGFRASRLEFNLLTLRVELADVMVFSKETPALPPLFRADRVAAALDTSKLIRGAYHVEDARIENPRVQLVIDRDGRDNIPKVPKTSEKKSDIDYLIRQGTIARGSVRYEDRKQQIDTTLPLEEISVRGDLASKEHDIRLKTADGGTLTYSARSLPIRGVGANVRLGRDSLAVRTMHAQLGDSTADLSGRLDGFDKPKVDLQGDLKLALQQLARFTGVRQNLSGDLAVALKAGGPLEQLRAAVRVTGSGLQVEQFEGLDLRANADYDAAASRVALQSVNLKSAWANIHGEGNLALTPQAGTSTTNLTAEGVRLERISTLLKLPVRVASTGTARVQARWTGMDFERAEGNAAVRLVPSRPAPEKDTIPVTAAIDAGTSGNRIVVDITDLQTMAAKASGKVELADRKSIGGQLAVEAPALSATVAAAEQFLGKEPGSLAGTPIEGALTSTVKLSGTVSSPQAAVTAAVPDLSAGDLRAIAVNASANYDPKRLAIDEAVVRWQDQTLRASGEIGLEGAQPLQLTARTENITARAMLAGLGKSDVPVSGNLAATIEVTGTASDPQATVNATATDLQAYSETVGTAQLRARYAAHRAELSELRLEKPQPGEPGLLTATGAYDLDSKRYQLQAKSQNLKLLALTLPGGKPVRGTVDVQADSSGTIDDPTGNIQLAVDGLQVDGHEFGRAEIATQLANARAQIQASLPRFGLNATGDIGIRAPNPATVEVRLENTDLSRLPVQMDPAPKGTISAVIQAKGELEHYEQGSANAQVSKLDVVWNDVDVTTDGPLTAAYANRMLTIQQAALTAAASRVELAGSLPLDPTAGEGSINLNAQLDLPGLTRISKVETKPDVNGQASIRGSIRGTLKRLDPNLTVSMDQASLAMEGLNPGVTNATLRAQIRDGALDLESISANWGKASFQASGIIPFALLPPDLPVELPRRQGPAKLNASLTGVDLAALATLPEKARGAVSLRLEAEAQKPELDAVHAVLTFPELSLGFDTYTVEQKGESRIVLENGLARVQNFQLSGPETELELAGTVQAAADHALDLRLNGKLDASLASMFSEDLRVRGATEIRTAVTGTPQAPRVNGFLEVADGQLSMREPRIGASGLNLRVDLEETRATVSRLEGEVNGGKLTGKGSVNFAGGKLQDSDLAVQLDDLFLDFPTGLKTVSDVRLQFRTVQDKPVLRGSVLLKQGGFTDDLFVDKGILAALTAPRSAPTGEKQQDSLMQSLRLNVSVVTQEPIIVENNLARAEITAQLVVVGTPAEPGLAGRLMIEEGGQLTLQERQYNVERGIITFTSDRRIEPNLDVLANTTAANYDITVQITGRPGETETALTSVPSLPEPSILALLVTGKTLDQIQGQEFEVARTQMLSYLTGRVGTSVGRRIESATGLSRVRVEPNLIAAEANPGARLTVGQDITPKLELVYSMDLVNSSDQIYAAEYDLTRRFVTRGVRQQDGSFRFDFRHELRFGGTPEERRDKTRNQRKIGNLTIEGRRFFTTEALQDKLKVEAGDDYDFFKLRRGMDRISRMHIKGGLLEANLHLQRDQKEGKVDLTLKVDSGPKVTIVFEGAAVPGDVQRRVRRVWTSGVFDTQRTEDAAGVIREWLIEERYLQPEITYRVLTPAPEDKRVVFEIHRGARFENVALEFEGARGIESKRLASVIHQQKLSTEVYTKPDRVTELLTQFYQEMGFLDAAVEKPRYDLNPETRTGRVVFPVKEGPLYRVGEALFEGNQAIDSQKLRAAVPLPMGKEYRPVLRENATRRVREEYWTRGYNDVEMQVEPERIPEQSKVNLRFRITENAQSIAKDIVISGQKNVSEDLIRTQLEIKPGDPVNLDKIGESRRKLYNTGAFSLVEIAREDAAEPSGGTRPVTLQVRAREVRPFELKYGGFFDTERGPGGIVDLSNRNSLGSARVLGLRMRYDSQLQEARLYFSQPLLSRFPVKTIASPYVRREINPETDLASAFNVDRIGFTLQQEAAVGRNFLLNYGYRIERSRTYDTGPDPVFDVPLRVAALTSTLSRDTRDEILDASKGSFFSHALQFSPESLGSQVRFLKYFGQYFRYIPLQKPRVQLFTNEVLRPRLVFATGVRVGLATGFGGQEVPVSERFFAGGATTIRGFQQNSVGPASFTGTQLGGQAMFVLNNEIRFPLVSMFDGVGFLDMGNVYPRVSDFSLTDIRKAAGAGLRVRTPWFLVRLDYGLKLDRKPGESRGRLFFSIGQAF